ncbi:MAG: thiamine pyrophosphate-binding protein [Gammaproteobacteria bacterium]|nr:thiamine pyrophosphate-binding protein [Gammaproteobacteria bacterium]MCP4088313.1 thiamine pyrophosphate-binding protein [Gammaproteobacteria bacterium]MCP4276376.1 thiamine pyrophosphate-binding protein [Gammaproteobacteria bacterium]MCP4831023.1 thiamine pyrophosphate-binding protein [Gammaproteobacteria bacterium]MCP4927456.1 thiamine pyrophosphate-binding protein [Gammaproteobacteria bacterium]
MRQLIKQLLDQDLSRRDFAKAMLAMGFSSAAAQSVLHSVAEAADGEVVIGYEFTGNGGEIVAECLKAAGIEYVFDTNSTGQTTFYDAVGQRPELNLIIALQEGQATSMAHGYELASGRTAALFMPSIGMPNTLCNLYNAWKDRSSLVVFSDGQVSDQVGRDGFQQVENWLELTDQFTKWQWQVHHPDRIAEMTRRALKVAGTQPGGPAYVKFPRDVLAADKVTQKIYTQEYFQVPVQMVPKPEVIEQAVQLLINAQSPIINAGPEVTRAGANGELLELAELLGIPVAQGYSVYGDFPFTNPLFQGFAGMGFPRGVRRADVFLNLGAMMPDEAIITQPVKDTAKVIDVRVEYQKIANRFPTEIPIAAGMQETISALLDGIKSSATAAQLEAIRAPRMEKAVKNFISAKERARKRVEKTWNSSPIAPERLCYEIDQVLNENAIVVVETGGRDPQKWMNFAPGKKELIGPTTGYALGWGIGAALGVKIAQPDRQVIAMVGDGAMLFGQIEALWTAARYEIPVIMVVFNNHSYDGERGRIKLISQLARENKDAWKDMSCYLGNPDINYVDIARGFEIAGSKLEKPGQIQKVMKRAIAATREGRPYIIDASILRRGVGAESTWHPDISIARGRSKKV